MPTRAKDSIHAAGGIVDPAVIDAALLAHRAVEDAATFGVPAEAAGERVACAVVLRQGETLQRSELRVFLARSLPPSHVPLDIAFVTAIPRSPTGRPQRRTLARHVASLRSAGLPAAQPQSQPEDLPALEAQLLEHWRTCLQRPDLHPDEDFFSAGGDEAQALAMLLEIKAEHGLRYKLLYDAFAYEPTIFQLAAMIRYGQEMTAPQPATHRLMIIPVQAGTPDTKAEAALPKLYLLPPDGDEGTCFRSLSDALGPSWPVSILRPAGLLHKPGPYQVEEAAGECAALIRADSAGRAFALGGFCYGGVLAAEIARLLGDECRALVLFDTPLPGHPHYPLCLRFARDHGRWLRAVLTPSGQPGWAGELTKTVLRRSLWHAIRGAKPALRGIWQTRPFQAVARKASTADMPFFFRLKPLHLPVLHLLSTGHQSVFWREAVMDWHQVAPGCVTVSRLRGAHLRLFFGANLTQMVRDLNAWFAALPATGVQLPERRTERDSLHLPTDATVVSLG